MKRAFLIFLVVGLLLIGLRLKDRTYGFFQKLFEFNQHPYTQKVLYVTSDEAILGNPRNRYNRENKRLKKGDILINLGKRRKDGKYKAKLIRIRFYGGPMSQGGGPRIYEDWIDPRYVEEQTINQVVYSEKVSRKPVVIFRDPRIGFVPGSIKLCGKHYPVGQAFPLIRLDWTENILSFQSPDGSICSFKPIPYIQYFSTKDVNWDSIRNQAALQFPIPSSFWKFVQGTLLTTPFSFLVFWIFWVAVIAYYFIFSHICGGLKGPLKNILLVLIISGLCLSLFQSCGHGIFLSGVKNGIPKDITFGSGTQKFWSVFYVPILFALISFSSFAILKSLFLTLILAFSRHPIKEAIVERERRREYDRKNKEYEEEIEDIEIKQADAHDKLVTLAKRNPEIIPEIIEYIPRDTVLYKGLFAEIARRMHEGQIKKTVRATRERIEEGKKLWEELAGLHRAKAEVKRAWSEFRMVDTEIAITEKRIEAERERVDLESDVKKLELQAKKLKLEGKVKGIEEAIKIGQKKEKGPSAKERFLQSVRDELEMMDAGGIAAGEIEEQRDRRLKNIDREKNPELYQRIKHMYDNLLIETMEKRKK